MIEETLRNQISEQQTRIAELEEDLREERATLRRYESSLAALTGVPKPRKPRVLSEEGRKAISEGQKERWEKWNKEQNAVMGDLIVTPEVE